MKKLFVPLSILFLLSGCAGQYYTVNPIMKSTDILNDNNQSFYLKNEKIINTEGTAFKEAFQNAQNDPNARNTLLSRFILLSDEVCEEHKGNILGNSVNFNVTLGGATTIFSSLATVVGAETTKMAFSAAATVSNASRSLVNEEVYYNSFAIAIIKAIDKEREIERLHIKNEMDKNTSQYTIVQGILDVNVYHNLCSFQNGLKIVSESVDRRKPSAMELREKIEFIKNAIKYNNENAYTKDLNNTAELYKKLQETQIMYLQSSY